jgi:hypothetical protein
MSSPWQALWESSTTAESRAHSCLLEFGERTVAATSAPAASDDGRAGGALAAAAADLERKFAALQVGWFIGATLGGSCCRLFQLQSREPLRLSFASLQRSARAEEESARQAAVRREGVILEQVRTAPLLLLASTCLVPTASLSCLPAGVALIRR